MAGRTYVDGSWETPRSATSHRSSSALAGQARRELARRPRRSHGLTPTVLLVLVEPRRVEQLVPVVSLHGFLLPKATGWTKIRQWAGPQAAMLNLGTVTAAGATNMLEV